MKKNAVVCLSVIIMLSLVLTGCSASKQQYPTKSIDLIVPASAGSGTDVVSRIIAKYLSKELGQPVNVVNKPGGNSVTGVQSVMSAQSDGYTLLADAKMWSSFQMLSKNLPFKVEDRTFICKVTAQPMVIFVSAQSSWKTFDELAAAIKADPENFTWGGLGGQSTTDLAQLQFFDAIGVDVSKLKKVVYQGGGEVMTATAGGHIMMGAGGPSGVIPFVQGGQLRVLGITSAQRIDALKDIPTTEEAGYPQITSDSWTGISGPADLPDEVVNRITEAMDKIVKTPEFNDELAKVTAVVKYVKTDDMKEEVLQEAEAAKKFFDTDSK